VRLNNEIIVTKQYEYKKQKGPTLWKVIGRAVFAGGSNRTDDPAVCTTANPIRFMACKFERMVSLRGSG
jgi:hypothetical protein